MALVRYKLDSKKPRKLTTAERSQLDAMTQEAIQRRAEADLDNPPLSDEELRRLQIGAPMQRLRRSLGLTQAEFAERFHINLSRLRDWEQGRFQPDSVALAFFRVIAYAPHVVESALAPERMDA